MSARSIRFSSISIATSDNGWACGTLLAQLAQQQPAVASQSQQVCRRNWLFL
jgi:hypothetical protein